MNDLMIHTNRELYLFVLALAQKHGQTERSLEDYLKALHAIAQRERKGKTVALATLTDWLERAFAEPAPAFDPAWLNAHATNESARNAGGFARWENRIQRQIVDLHEMAACGALANDMRYFGIDSPRGARWYNFTPLSFLECGVEGAFGGWREGDPGGRGFVPGPVAVLGQDGEITSVDPREIDDPEVAIDPLGWDGFSDLLEMGQWYE